MIQGYKSPRVNNDTEFGTAFHLGRKLLALTGDSITSYARATRYFRTTPMIVKPKKGWMDAALLQDTLEGYENNYAEDVFTLVRNPADNKPLVELQFAYPYRVEDDIEVLIVGTMDEVCHHALSDTYVIKDYKTTSTWSRNEYLESYALSSQLMFYKFALESYGKLFPDSIIGKVCERPVGCVIDGIFLGASKPPAYERSRVFYYPPDQMEESQALLSETIDKLIDLVRNPKKARREGMMNGCCEKVYGKCQYFGVCCETREDSREFRLNEDFIRVPYDPRTNGNANEV